AEEDELYEENDEDESYDPTLLSTEAVINDDEVIEEFDEQDDRTGFDDAQGEKEHQETVNAADLEQLPVPVQRGIHLDSWWRLTSSDTEDGTANDDDDLISYEEAVDQTEDGQDYRQQYLNEETTTDKAQNGETSQHQIVDYPDIIPPNGNHIAP